jgi:FtsZ-binding cell division protein ZapB
MTSMYEHTKGEWTAYGWVNDQVSWNIYVSNKDKRLETIARLPLDYDDVEKEANAKLIAAAPDLLRERDALKAENEALREALELFIKYDQAPEDDDVDLMGLYFDAIIAAKNAIKQHEATE